MVKELAVFILRKDIEENTKPVNMFIPKNALTVYVNKIEEIQGLVKKLHYEITKIAVVDSHVIFANKNWYQETSELLNRCQACQLFENYYKVDIEGRLSFGEHSAAFHFVNNHTVTENFLAECVLGYGWAGHRKWIEDIGLTDMNCMAQTFVGVYDKKTDWNNNAEFLSQKTGCTRGTILLQDDKPYKPYKPYINKQIKNINKRLYSWPVNYKDETLLVVIPAKDCVYLTERCLKNLSLYSDIPYKVLYIDDNSKDGVIESIKKIASDLSIDIEILENPKGISFTKACNIGFKRGYRHTLLLNNDCFIGPKCLSRMRDHLESESDIACVGPVTGDDGPQSLKMTSVRNLIGTNREMINPYDEYEGANICNNTKNTALNFDKIAFFCTMFRGDAILEIGYQDTHSKYGYGLGADYDWCQRSQSMGWRNVLCCDAFAAHLQSASFKLLDIDRHKFTRIALDRFNSETNILSIITRKHKNRPKSFIKLLDSVDKQTKPLDHVIIDGSKCKNIQEAEKLLSSQEILNKSVGDYIQVVDDDDFIVYNDYTEKLEKFIQKNSYPDWVMVKSSIDEDIYPKPFGKEWRPAHTTVTSSCMVISRDIWEIYNSAWSVGQHGDWLLALTLWNAGLRPVWFDYLACSTQHGASNGVGE